ncbi:COG2426 family protein [Enterococcus sp. LJL98]
MLETVLSFFQSFLDPKVTVFVISLLPILELRGGLIAASLLGVPWQVAAPIAVIGNMLPVPFIIFFIETILNFLSVRGPIQKLASKMIEKGRSGGEQMLAKYPNRLMIGLFLFVAIPLPGTGAWTGSLIAALLGLPPKKSVVPIALGILTACVIMLILTYYIPGLFGFK